MGKKIAEQEKLPDSGQTGETELHWCSGVDDTGVPDKALLQKLKGQLLPPEGEGLQCLWSWWEPEPAAWDGKGDRPKIHPMLRQGCPDFHDLQVAECRLFLPGAGLHLVADRGKTRWFAFREAEPVGDESKWKKADVQYRETPVLARNAAAYGLFGIDMNQPHHSSLSLREYFHEGKRMAWTVRSMP